MSTPPSRLDHVRDFISSIPSSAHLGYRLVNAICSIFPESSGGYLRARLYRRVGMDIHRTAFIQGNLRLTSGMPGFYGKLHIGRNVIIGGSVMINLDDHVVIGDNASISPLVRIFTGSHTLGFSGRRMDPTVTPLPVVVEEGTWIAVGALLLPGAHVGRGSVVSGGAVVSGPVPPNTYVRGPSPTLTPIPVTRAERKNVE